MPSKSSYYVYAHLDKETRVPFYIGIGKDRRAFDRSRHEFWEKFVSKYLHNDFEVAFVAIDIDEFTAREIEGYFIEKFGKVQEGTGILLNWMGGGLGEGTIIGLSKGQSKIKVSLTDFGSWLYGLKLPELNLDKINQFFEDWINEMANEIREKMVSEIHKEVNPKKPWVVPFCVNGELNSDAEILVMTDNLEKIKGKVEKGIKSRDLPKRAYVDNILHRIMIYFDLILQDSVWLEVAGERISAPNKDWHFYKDYWNGYMKIIQGMNKGLQLSARYLGVNKTNNEIEAIRDFEVWKVGS